MKWKGIVSQVGQSSIATRFAAANANHAASTAPKRLSRGEPVPAMPHGLDRGLRAELLPQPPDADVDHVGPRIEVVPPDVREQALARHDLALVQDGEPVELREQQVKDDEVVPSPGGLLNAGAAVGRAVDGEAFSLEAAGQERQDPRLVLDDKDPHLPTGTGA